MIATQSYTRCSEHRYSWRHPTDSTARHLIDLERACCPFLTFKLIVVAGQQPVRLEITGAPEAKAVIADFFGS